ncbi:putative adipose-regulatory protein-domain-containing protein [Neurospora crassa]|nr:putative adipose-regulatory protein-domain-containing protein [Neurospora crassa]
MSAPDDTELDKFELGTVSESYTQIKQQLRDIKDALCDLAYEILTSKTTQKTVIYSILGTTASIIFYGMAIIIYISWYNRYLPAQVTTVPLHLQYGYGPNPYGISPLTSYNIKTNQPYDITVTLNLPRSPTNVYRETGNFMVALHLLNGSPEIQRVIQPPVPPLNPDNPLTGKPGGPDIASFITPIPPAVPDPIFHLTHNKILFSSTRAAVIPYIDPLVAQAKRVMFLGYHVLFPEHAEMVTLQVPLAEKVQFPRRSGRAAARLGLVGDGSPTSLLVEVQAGQKLQVYDAKVTMTAKLGGLRWFMYHHRIISFVVGTWAVWVGEMVSLVVAWVIGGYMLSRMLEGGSGAVDKGEEGKLGRDVKGKRKARLHEGSGTGDGYDPEHETSESSSMSDTERTFPSRFGAPPLKYEPWIKQEQAEEEKEKSAAVTKEEEDEEDDDLYDLPVHLPSVREAGHEFRDSGIGSSGYSDVSSTTAVGSGSSSGLTARRRRKE